MRFRKKKDLLMIKTYFSYFRYKDRVGPNSTVGENDAVDARHEASPTQQELFKQKLIEKEREIEKLKRGPTSRSPSPTKSPMPPAKDDTMSDVISAFDSSRSEKNRAQLELRRRLDECVEENKILTQAITEKGLRGNAEYLRKIKSSDKKISQQKTEISALNGDNEKKRKRIRELLTAIEEIKQGTSNSNTKSQKKINELCDKTKEDEMSSVLEKLKKSKNEVNEWKNKADSYQQELDRLQQQQTTKLSSKQNVEDDSIMDQQPPVFDNEADLLTPEPSMTLPLSINKNDDDTLCENMGEQEHEHLYERPIDGAHERTVEAVSTKTETSAKKSVSRIPSPVKRSATKSTANSESNKKQSDQVSDSLTRQELDIYRTNLDMNEHDTLDILGPDKLNYVIEFQISRRCMTELRTIKNDIYELEYENETLQTNYVNLADSVNEFNDDIRNKLDKTDDNTNLKRDLHEDNTRLELELGNTFKIISELNEKIAEKDNVKKMVDKKIQKLEAEISETKQKEQDWINEINALQKANESLCCEMQQTQKDNKDLCARLKNKEDEKKAREGVSKGGNKIKGEIKLLKEELNAKTTECDSLKENLKNKTEEFSKLQKKYNGVNIIEKNRKLKKIKEELLEKTKELQDINGQLEERIEEVNILKSQLKSKQHESSKEDLEAIASLRKEISGNAAEILKRNEIIQELRTHVDKIKEQDSERYEEQKMEIQKYEEKQEQHDTLIQKYMKEITQLKTKVKEKDSESEVYLDETVRAMKDAKERLVQEINTRKRLEEDVLSLNEKLEYTKQRNEIMSKELKEGKTEIVDLVRALEESQTHAQLMEEKIEEQNEPQVNQNLMREIENLQIEIKESNEKLQQTKKEKEKALGNLARLSDEYASYRKAVEEEIVRMTKEVEMLKTKISWLEAEKKKVPPPKMPAIQEEIVEYEPVKDSMSVPCSSTSEKIEEVITAESAEMSMAVPCDFDFPSEMTQEQAELEVELEILQGCNEELEQEVENLKNQMEMMEKDKTELEKQLDVTKADLKKTLNYLEQVSQKNVSLIEKIDSKEQSLRVWENKANEIEQQLSEQDNNDSAMEHQVEKLELDLQTRDSTIRELEDLMDQLESENLRKDDALEKLRTNNEKNIEELEKVTRQLEDEFNTRELIVLNREQLEQEIREKENSLTSLQEHIQKLVERESENTEKFEFEILRLQNNLNLESQHRREDTKMIESLREKSNQQEHEIEQLSKRNEMISLADTDKDGGYQANQNEALRKEIETKSMKIKTLQQELKIRDDQYEKVLASLNKRREDSKKFLNMQQKLRDEIDSKEDLIRKLNFKLKSNDLDITASSLNVSRDNDLDQSDGAVINESQSDERTEDESANQDKVIVISHHEDGEGDSFFELSKQFGKVRSRNKFLSRELETCRTQYMTLLEEKSKNELINHSLTEDNEMYKNRVTELRDMIQNTPDTVSDDGPESVEIRTKLFASYKELREKSIETASLRMCVDVKDDEIVSLRDEIDNLCDEIRSMRAKSESLRQGNDKTLLLDLTDGNTSQRPADNIRTLLTELQSRDDTEIQLRDDVAELRKQLMTKSKQNDSLQLELNKITTRFKDIEQKLGQNDLELRNRFLRVFEQSDNSEISEVTPLNSVKLYSGLEHVTGADNDSDNDEFSLTENLKKDDDGNDEYSVQFIRERQLKTEEENLFYKAQVKSLQEEVDRINQSHLQKTDENRNLQRLLSDLQVHLRDLETTKNEGE